MEISEKRKSVIPARICSYCCKLLNEPRVEEDSYNGESLLDSSNSSHGICPECLLENFPQEYLAIQKERRVRIKNIFKNGYEKLYTILVK